MKIEDIKKIPIVELLSNLGFEPAYRTGGGKQCVYHSLFNTDLTPSFSVSVPKNVWFDFSSNIGGNIIDLAMAIKGCSFSSAVYWLEEQYRSFGGVSRLEFSIMGTYDETIENTLCKVSTVPLERPALKKYLSSRGIFPEVSEMYCREAHYWIRGRQYYGVCFMNVLGGMEIRSQYFKGCHGTKAPSIIPVEKTGKTESCCLFEGFMDFLSYKTMEVMGDRKIPQEQPCDCVVLNSTSMVKKTLPFIKVYPRVFCYLDNDDSGRNAFEIIKGELVDKAISCSDRFLPCGDVNDYLMRKEFGLDF